MSQTINATFADGAFKPDEIPNLPTNARVRLTIECLDALTEDRAEALRELEDLWESEPVRTTQPALSRDQLHDRR
jgi:hypothetical protein